MLYLKKFFLPRLRCSKHFHYIFFVKIPLAVGLAEPCDTWISRLRSPSCGYNISPQQRQNINNNFFSSDQIAFNMFSVNSEKLRNEQMSIFARNCWCFRSLHFATFCFFKFLQTNFLGIFEFQFFEKFSFLRTFVLFYFIFTVQAIYQPILDSSLIKSYAQYVSRANLHSSIQWFNETLANIIIFLRLWNDWLM